MPNLHLASKARPWDIKPSPESQFDRGYINAFGLVGAWILNEPQPRDLSGNGITAPRLSLLVPVLDFSDAPIGMVMTKPVTLSNTGNDVLQIDALTTTHPAFGVVWNTSVGSMAHGHKGNCRCSLQTKFDLSSLAERIRTFRVHLERVIEAHPFETGGENKT